MNIAPHNQVFKMNYKLFHLFCSTTESMHFIMNIRHFVNLIRRATGVIICRNLSIKV